MSDAPVDKANKRANKKVQEPNPVGDGERNETPSRTTGPAEQGILSGHHMVDLL